MNYDITGVWFLSSGSRINSLLVKSQKVNVVGFAGRGPVAAVQLQLQCAENMRTNDTLCANQTSWTLKFGYHIIFTRMSKTNHFSSAI